MIRGWRVAPVHESIPTWQNPLLETFTATAWYSDTRTISSCRSINPESYANLHRSMILYAVGWARRGKSIVIAENRKIQITTRPVKPPSHRRVSFVCQRCQCPAQSVCWWESDRRLWTFKRISVTTALEVEVWVLSKHRNLFNESNLKWHIWAIKSRLYWFIQQHMKTLLISVVLSETESARDREREGKGTNREMKGLCQPPPPPPNPRKNSFASIAIWLYCTKREC